MALALQLQDRVPGDGWHRFFVAAALEGMRGPAELRDRPGPLFRDIDGDDAWAAVRELGATRLPPAADPGLVRAALLGDRKAKGAWYTPPDVVEFLVEGIPDDAEVIDLAAGAGAFFLGRLARDPHRLHGRDTDRLALDLAVTRLARLTGADPEALATRIHPGDPLAEPLRRTFDAVVGNPPFLTPLKAARPDVAALKALHGDRIGPYTDAATVFLLEADRLARGHVGLVLPASLFAARDAEHARAGLRHQPVAVRTLPRTFPVAAAAVRFAPAPARAWAPLLSVPDEPPPLVLAGPPLATVARATADFRDEYYALRDALTEGGPGLRLVTVGMIDVAGVSPRPARIHGVTWASPHVDPARLPPRFQRWAESRAVPKLLVATQTRVVEAAADPAGTMLGVTPVISVFPTGIGLDALGALLNSPVASAWAHRTFRGAALNLDVIKLAAAQLLSLPLPPAWAEAAALFPLAHSDPDALRAMGEATTRAWDQDPAVTEWWWGRVTRGPSRARP